MLQRDLGMNRLQRGGETGDGGGIRRKGSKEIIGRKTREMKRHRWRDEEDILEMRSGR